MATPFGAITPGLYYSRGTAWESRFCTSSSYLCHLQTILASVCCLGRTLSSGSGNDRFKVSGARGAACFASNCTANKTSGHSPCGRTPLGTLLGYSSLSRRLPSGGVFLGCRSLGFGYCSAWLLFPPGVSQRGSHNILVGSRPFGLLTSCTYSR